MYTITISTLKGGEGKSSIGIIYAKYLASIGKRVLVIDLDPQNSTSFFFVSPGDNRNIANALFTNELKENIIPNISPGIDIAQSDLKLFKLHSSSSNVLRNILKQVQDDYDYCVIDTAPSWDALVISALRAANLILHPATLKNTFSIKTSLFLQAMMKEEIPEALSNVVLFYNFYPSRTGPESRAYESEYENIHEFIFESHLKDTAEIKYAIDGRREIVDAVKFPVLYPFLESLHNEVLEFADMKAKGEW